VINNKLHISHWTLCKYSFPWSRVFLPHLPLALPARPPPLPANLAAALGTLRADPLRGKLSPEKGGDEWDNEDTGTINEDVEEETEGIEEGQSDNEEQLDGREAKDEEDKEITDEDEDKEENSDVAFVIFWIAEEEEEERGEESNVEELATVVEIVVEARREVGVGLSVGGVGAGVVVAIVTEEEREEKKEEDDEGEEREEEGEREEESAEAGEDEEAVEEEEGLLVDGMTEGVIKLAKAERCVSNTGVALGREAGSWQVSAVTEASKCEDCNAEV